MCWETSEQEETWRSSVLFDCYHWLLSPEHSEWRNALPFLICPSNYFVFIPFCVLKYGKLRYKRGLCCISAGFLCSSLVLCMYGSQHLFLQRIWKLFTKPFQLPSPLLSIYGASFVELQAERTVSREEPRTCACIESDWQGASFSEIP